MVVVPLGTSVRRAGCYKCEQLAETELYRSLGALTRSRERWEENIPYVASLLRSDSVKIQAKALWLLGEMGLAFPAAMADNVPAIADFLDSEEPLLRERALNAIGRVGRGRYQSVEPYWQSLFRFAGDGTAAVRLAFVWASENMATNTPDVYGDHMSIYAELLHDGDDRVRMEVPEMFRVVGTRRPEYIEPYLGLLHEAAENDSNQVVRIHCLGAIRLYSRQQCGRACARSRRG